MFPKLFERGRLGRLEVANRIIKAPTLTCLGALDGSVTDRMIEFYEEMARGGAGLVVVEYSWIDKKASKSRPSHLGIAGDEFVPGLSSLAQAIQDNGAKAALQIGHCGMAKTSGLPPIKCVSKGVPPDEIDAIRRRGGVVPEELTFEEIQEIILAFAAAAGRAQLAGFDAVELHGAHGYLITEFLSPRTNIRTDWYGGSPENRFRFLKEIVLEIRKKVGPSYPLGVRLSGTEYEPDGLMIEDTIEIARSLEALGIDYIHVSGASRHQGVHLTGPMSVPLGQNVWAAEAVKKAIGIPVVASGSITTPEFAEEIIASGKADYVALARPLFADPYWPRKAKEGRPEDIRPCVRCNDGCQARSNGLNLALQCGVNVTVGKEKRLAITRVEHPKQVAVIGGGPAGMEAARVCALRGHQVTLFEKRELGGALIEAAVPDFKADFRRLLAYYANQMKKLKVEVVRIEATAQTIKDGGFDAAIVAVGAMPLRLEVHGLDGPTVVSALDVLGGKAKVGERVLVIGGGMVGTETGLWLAEQGKEVIFAEMLDQFMTNVVSWDRAVYEERLAKQKVTIYTGKRLDAVIEGGARLVDSRGKKQEVLVDTVVLAVGFAPQTALREQLESEASLDVQAVGDCLSPRKFFDAIHEGFLAGRRI